MLISVTLSQNGNVKLPSGRKPNCAESEEIIGLSRTCSMRLARDSKGFTKKEGNYRLRVRRADKVDRYNVERQTLTVMKQRRRFVLSLPFICVSRIFLLFLPPPRRIQIEMGNVSLSIFDRLFSRARNRSFFSIELKSDMCLLYHYSIRVSC